MVNYHPWVDRYTQTIACCSQNMGNWLASFLIEHWLGVINFYLVIILLGSLFAPYLAHWGYLAVSRLIYGVYHIACHQKDNRCLYVLGHKLGLCARCFSIYFSLLIFGLIWSLLANVRKKIKPIRFWLAFLLVTPLILDGLTQSLGLRESTTFLRIATGCLFSSAIALWVYPRIKPELTRLNSVAGKSFR